MAEARKQRVGKERPWLYGLLIAPSGIVTNGVVQGGVLAYVLRQQGVDIARISSLVTLLALPTMLYCFWSPVTDFLMRRRSWVMTGSVVAAVLMGYALGQPHIAEPRVLTLIFLSGCSTQLVVASCGGMMGAMTDERNKRVAGSFYQAGSMGFGAVSVSVLVWVYVHFPRALGWTAAGVIALPGLLAVLAPKEPRVRHESYRATMQQLWVETRATFWRWEAIPYTLLMVFPMASGAAVGLLPGVAQDYGVSGDQVAWMNGLLGTALTAAGSLLASLLPARVRASVVYLSLGMVNALTLCVLWLGPLRPGTYLAGVVLYLFTVGACYAMFTAVVLEFLGVSGRSGSGRYSVINSLGNVPVLYMIRMDGWGGGRFGPRGVAGTEAVLSLLGGGALLAYFLLRKRGETAAEERAEAAGV